MSGHGCLVEMLADENAKLKEQVQQLKDEINRLKGEQGKPNVRGQSNGSNGNNTNHSSEDDRNKRRKLNWIKQIFQMMLNSKGMKHALYKT